jgi:Subtilase family
MSYPARVAESGVAWDSLFSIGSVASSDQLSSFTNRGTDVSFYAPGESLNTFFPNKATINVTKTSFSAPLVTGSLALGLSQLSDPIFRSTVGSSPRYSQEQQRIWLTINNNGTTPWAHSYGRIDLERFLLTAFLESIATVFVSISSRNAVLFVLAPLGNY